MRSALVVVLAVLGGCKDEPLDEAPVPDAAPPVVDAQVIDAQVIDARVSDARVVDATPDAGPTDAGDAGPAGGTVGFQIVAGAAIIEVDPEIEPRKRTRKRRPKRSRKRPLPAAPTSAAAPVARRVTPLQTIRAHMGDVRHCYGRVALKDPTIAGRLTLQWTIGKDGWPQAVAIVKNTLKDKSVGTCLKARAKRWRFPPPAGGVQVVRYPFDLRVQ